MSEKSEPKSENDLTRFDQRIGAKAARKLRAQRSPARNIWFGLGMMGVIGWSVVVPTLMGAAAGIWLDNRHPGSHSWTLMLLVAGLVVGCAIAWQWVAKEDKAMRDEQENGDE